MKKKDLILICARKGSKGIKNKNLKRVGKIQLFIHSIKIAKKLQKKYEIFVSSDSKKIIDLSKKENVKTILRSSKLSNDKTPEILVWKDALKKFKKKFLYLPKKIIILPPTSPLRKLNDIKKCIKKYQTNKYNLVITGYKSNHNPYFNMVKKHRNYVKILLNKGIHRRQDAPDVYNISTVCYIINTKYLEKTSNIFNKSVGMVEIPQARAIDIDDKLDLFIANKIYEKQRFFN